MVRVKDWDVAIKPLLVDYEDCRRETGGKELLSFSQQQRNSRVFQCSIHLRIFAHYLDDTLSIWNPRTVNI